MRLTDVGEVVDQVENIRNAGLANGKPSVLVILYRAPGANIIETVDRVYALLPELRAAISPAIDLTAAVDRSTTIRASLKEVERTLLISVVLVIVVVFLFLRSGRATLVPSVAVPVSLIGTFAAMYLLDYSLDNLSLMALTVATGFVVDDAIVVLENISRHIEAGMPRVEAAIRGAGEVVVHRDLDEHLADRRVHSDPADGRHRRPAVPRIRHDAVGGDPDLARGVAGDHPDDVRAAAQAHAATASKAAFTA